MYIALYALLIAAGIAFAWRSNPLYSLGRTARFLALMALAMAIFVGALVAMIHVAERLSTTGAGVLVAATTLAGTIFLIWATITASTPRVPKTAAGTPLVCVNRAHVMPWIPRLLVGLAFFALLCAVLHGELRDAVLIIGGMFAGLAIALVFTLYIAALGMDRSLTSVKAASWLHWTYTAEAWTAWRAVLVDRTAAMPRTWQWRRDGKRLAASFVIVAAGIMVLEAWVMPLIWRLSYVAVTAILMIVGIEITARIEATAPERLRRFLLHAPAETYVGDAGIFCDGAYVQWQTASSWLSSATID